MGENPVENEEKLLVEFWNWKKNDDSLFTKMAVCVVHYLLTLIITHS